MKKTILILGAMLLVGGGIGWAVNYLQRPTRAEYLREVNARARTDARFDTLSATFNVLAIQAIGDRELLQRVVQDLPDLAERIRSLRGTVLSTQRTVASLEERFQGEAPVETLPDSSRRVQIEETNTYESGSQVGILGTVDVPPEGAALVDLKLWGILRQKQTCFQIPAGDIRCDVDLGIPTFVVDSVEVLWNIDPPDIDDFTRKEFQLLRIFESPLKTIGSGIVCTLVGLGTKNVWTAVGCGAVTITLEALP